MKSNVFALVLMVLFSVGCSSSNPSYNHHKNEQNNNNDNFKKNYLQNSYSQETQDTFHEIEQQKARNQLIDNYRMMRAQDWERRERQREGQRERQRQYEKNKSRPKFIQIFPAPLKENDNTTIERNTNDRKENRPGNLEDIKIEISQNQNYFCMKMRKSSRFQNEDECKLYTEDVYNQCLEQFAEDNPRLVICLKSHLK